MSGADRPDNPAPAVAAPPAPRADEEEIPIEQALNIPGTPEEIERFWYTHIYQGDRMKQLTPRAILLGMLLGGFMSVSNIYIGLKTGWSLGVAITACILAYSLSRLLRFLRVPGFRDPYTILENNCMQSAASAAGFIAGAGLVSAIPALQLLFPDQPDIVPGTGTLILWMASIASLGVVLAVPMKRQMINIEQLKFPSGVAAAETLRSLHHSGGAALRKTVALFVAMVIGAAVAFLRDAPETWPLPFRIQGTYDVFAGISIGGFTAYALTFALEGSVVLAAAGAIVGPRIAISMMVGAIINFAVIAPIMIERHEIHLTIEQPLAALPAGVHIPEDLADRLQYHELQHRLRWHGVMSPQQRDRLAALSADPAWGEAVESLYRRSQFRLAVALPAGVAGIRIPADLAARVELDAQRQELIARAPLTEAQLGRLRALSNDPRWQEAAEELSRYAQLGQARPNYRDIVHWTLWPGVAIMVASGLLAFAFQWRTVARAFRGLKAIVSPRSARPADDDPLAPIEVPASWFVIGVIITGGACLWIQQAVFGISWWMAIIGVVLTFFLCIVACRATGETDITPIGAMGKITQLTYGVLAPKQMVTNLMTAQVTAGAASHAADLLTDLKSGYLLGAKPRYQFIAQFCGVLAGACVVVPVYKILIPDAQALGAQYPAPAAQVWKGVAELLGRGIGALPVSARWALLIGTTVGVLVLIMERALPKYRRWLPSATGLGLALIIPAYNSISMLIGAMAAVLLARLWPRTAQEYVIPVASGLIAGESLMAVALAILQATTGLAGTLG